MFRGVNEKGRVGGWSIKGETKSETSGTISLPSVLVRVLAQK